MRFRLVVDGELHELEVDGTLPSLVIRVDGATYRARASGRTDAISVRIGPNRHRIAVRGRQVTVDGIPSEVVAEGFEPLGASTAGTEGSRAPSVVEVRPPMPGRIVKVAVSAGDHVKRGQTLAVLEAMKMQNEIAAPAEAVVKSVGVREGESIPGDRVIAVLEGR